MQVTTSRPRKISRRAPTTRSTRALRSASRARRARFESSRRPSSSSIVYWSETEADADADVTQGYWWGDGSKLFALHRDKLGGNATRLFGTTSTIRNFSALPFFAVDASNAYWISYTTGGFGDIVRGAKDGSSQQTLVAGVPTPRELEIAGDTLFFVSGTSLYSIRVDGTNERLVRDAWSATEYVVGATHVYAADGGGIVRVTRTGEILEPIVPHAVGVAYEGLSIGDDGYVNAIQLIEPRGVVQTANVLRVSTDGKTPSIVVPNVQSELLPTDHLFTAVDGTCLVYTTLQGVFRRCAEPVAIGPGQALEAPVMDATSVYWRAHTDLATTVVYAACKL